EWGTPRRRPREAHRPASEHATVIFRCVSAEWKEHAPPASSQRAGQPVRQAGRKAIDYEGDAVDARHNDLAAWACRDADDYPRHTLRADHRDADAGGQRRTDKARRDYRDRNPTAFDLAAQC